MNPKSYDTAKSLMDSEWELTDVNIVSQVSNNLFRRGLL